MPHSVALSNKVQRCTPALLSARPKTFSPSLSWGKQTSSFCRCQCYVWHTTVCLRKQHWKDQCVFCYLGLFDRTTRVVVRSCLAMMHRLCRCLLSQHIHQPLHREGNDSAAGNMGDAALQHIELSNNSVLSFIIFQQNHPNVMMIWYCNSVLLSEPMISS